ncbi:hypothetical protein VSDG_03229 [Cytospora chrysosperma]|uniref:NACHT domain-containing protein n=1 Tax=Cytospora chrysosperma TaxID=252740 RepID=A0A423WBL2_CYTCH|nr:hypothetical protein VSDG_03229 [Valsa sordida]
MSIKPLPGDVVAQIKSSVAITSLNSVICGLVKNALDAEATKINLAVDYSRGNCSIEDNGVGIPPLEFKDTGGLGQLHYVYGKHGAFLASVASLSLFTITSHHRDYHSHNSMTIHNSRVLARHMPCLSEQRLLTFSHGTRATARDLFGSMPVRVKHRALQAEKSSFIRDWDQLLLDLVALLIAWPGAVSLSIRESSTRQNLVLGTASFIALGIEPLTNEFRSNILYEEVNKVFADSSFGAIDDEGDSDGDMKEVKMDGFVQRELKIRKGVDRWPMFFLKLSPASEAAIQRPLGVDDILDERQPNLGLITDLIKAMFYEFLKNNLCRPKKVVLSAKSKLRRHGGNGKSYGDVDVVFANSVKARLESDHSTRLSLAEEDARNNTPRLDNSDSGSESPFAAWSRIKSGHTLPTFKGTAQPLSRAQSALLTSIGPNRTATPGHGDTKLSRPVTIEPSRPPLYDANGKLTRKPFEDVDPKIFSSKKTQQTETATPSTPQSQQSWQQLPQRSPEDGFFEWINPVTKMVSIVNSRTGCMLPPKSLTLKSHYEATALGLQGRLSKDTLDSAVLVSQVDRKFILAKVPFDRVAGNEKDLKSSMLVLIDQHAADERCRVEGLMEDYFKPSANDDGDIIWKAATELLPKPLQFEVYGQDKSVLDRFQDYFAHWGICYDVESTASGEGGLDMTSKKKMDRTKAKVVLALETSNSINLGELKKETREIHEAIKQQCTVHEQQEILCWLEPGFPKNTDPETLQTEKFSLQEENTCNWMVKTLWWSDWLAGGPSAPPDRGCRRFMWIHGLPGSGKTILASYLIDQIARNCTSRGYSYYYCFHVHNRDETIPLLRWVVRDLTIQLGRCVKGNHISTELYSMWQYRRPTVESLLRCLQVLAWEFFTRLSKRVYIVVDGVDESKAPRNTLLQVLTDIGTKPEFETVSLLMTSRDYPDIREPTRTYDTDQDMDIDDMMASAAYLKQGSDRSPSPTKQKRQASGNQEARAPSPQKRKISPGGSYVDVGPEHKCEDSLDPDLPEAPCSILSMSNHFVKKAIETFIQQQLTKSERFVQWPRPDFIDKMKIELAAKAGGMFRTVSCHLDMIERLDLTDQDAILKEIKDMPQVIFDMYEKIIVDGMSLLEAADKNRHNREFARTALALICSETSQIPDAGVLVEAARLHVPQGIAQDYNFKKLERLLGCLAKVTRFRKITPSLYRRDDDEPIASGLHKKRFSVAHYTVKEYLYHEKTANGPAREFALSSEKTRILELTVVFYGLRNYSTSGHPKKNPTRFDEYCLKMTDKALSERPAVVVNEEDIWAAVISCLPWNAHHQNAIRNRVTREAFPNWARLAAAFEDGCAPKYQETCILVSLLLLHWHELAHVYLETLTLEKKDKVWKDEFSLREDDCKTILQMSVSRRNTRFLKEFVNAGAMFQEESDILFRALENPYDDETCNGKTTGRLLRTLLDRGADPNPGGYKFTPLQLATRQLEHVWVRHLLSAGASPDAVGSPKGVEPPGFESDRSWHKKPPMAICNDESLKPEWEQDEEDNDEILNSRKRVRELLRQFQDLSLPGGGKGGQGPIVGIADED